MKTLITILFLLNSLFFSGYSQSGTIDLTFNPNDLGYGVGDGTDRQIKTVAIQNDGKILIGGNFTKVDSTNINGIIRINETGTFDTSFHTGSGFNSGMVWPENVLCLKPLDNGKILVGGNFISYNGIPAGGLVRLNNDGSIDTSFNIPSPGPSPIFSILINDIESLSNGKFILVGRFSEYQGILTNHMIVINEDGSIDSTFNTNFGSNSEIYSVTKQPDQKLLVYGDFSEFNGTTAYKFTRLFPDFTIDTTFDIGSGPYFIGSGYGASFNLNPDNSIFFYNGFSGLESFNGYSPQNGLVKLFPNGSIDTTFIINEFDSFTVLDVHNLQNGDQIFVGSFNFQGENRNMFKLLSNGTVDLSYFSDYSNLFLSNTTTIDSLERLLYIGDDFGFSNAPLLRFNVNGSLDTIFLRSSGANNLVLSSFIQNDGKALLFGIQTLYNGKIVDKIFRVFDNGELDTSFHCNVPINSVSGLIQMDNGQYYISGVFQNNQLLIMRLNPDGTLDSNFQTFPALINGYSFPNLNAGMQLQMDNKIVVWGMFTAYGGISTNRLVRLNSDGSIDNAFITGTGLNIPISKVLVQPDQKILLLKGSSFTYNGTVCNGAVRLNTNGTIDNSFNPGSGFNGAIRSGLVSNNKIILTGDFTEYNNTVAKRIIQLNLDGTIDTTFNCGTGFDSTVNCIYVQNDHKILLGGEFTSYNNYLCNGIFRLNPNGSVDTTINFGNGFPEGEVYSINLMADEQILVTGNFHEFDSIGRNRLVLINNCVQDYDTMNITSCDSYVWTANNQTYYNSGTYTEIFTNSTGCDSIVTLNLNIIPSAPLSINTFSLPSPPDTCIGALAINALGTPDFQSLIDGGSPINYSGYFLADTLCTGVHSLLTVNGCGDSLSVPFVIPIDSNYVFNNPYLDSLVLDSLGVTMVNCQLYYNSIDTAYIDSIFANGNSIAVIWNIVDSNGSNYDTTNYMINNGNGIYYLQLSVFCPSKALGEFFTVTEAIYFNDDYLLTTLIKDTDLNIFPNPTNEYLTISNIGEKASVTLYNIHGTPVLNISVLDTSTISLKDLSDGVYFIRITTESKDYIRKIVKSNF